MWKDILLIIGFVITIIAWFGVTPRQMVKVIKDQKVINFERFDLLLVALSFVAIGIIIYYGISGTGNVWYYVQFSYAAIYPWLLKVSYEFIAREKYENLFTWLLIISAILLQIYSVPTINTILQSVHESGYLVKSWITIGFVIFAWLMTGMNIGTNIFFIKYIKRLKNLQKLTESQQQKLSEIKTMLESTQQVSKPKKPKAH